MMSDAEGGQVIRGHTRTIASVDSTPISVVSAGSGPPLLLVHGGMTSSARWQPLWPYVTMQHEVSAMDRRGRGRSGDQGPYSLEREFQDVAAVATDLADRHGGPIDVFGHSIGAVCVLGAASAGASFRRIALYEPPGPETVPRVWIDRATEMVAAGEHGRAMGSFLVEVIGLTLGTVTRLRDSPVAHGSLDIVAATLVREAEALATVDVAGLAARVVQPVLLLLGSQSPDWAGTITQQLTGALRDPTLVTLAGCGHEGVDTAPRHLSTELTRFLAR